MRKPDPFRSFHPIGAAAEMMGLTAQEFDRVAEEIGAYQVDFLKVGHPQVFWIHGVAHFSLAAILTVKEVVTRRTDAVVAHVAAQDVARIAEGN